MKPWYYEDPNPSMFNMWTLVHVGVGALAARYIQSFTGALFLHTIYEIIEKDIFPHEARDISTENHIGDTLGFSVGFLGARKHDF